LLARHAGLDAAIEIVGVDLQHTIHLREIDADAAVQRGNVAFERRAHTECDHRNTRQVTQANDRRHLVVRAREYDHVGQRGVSQPLAVAVVLAHRLRGHGALAVVAANLRDQTRDDVGVGPYDGLRLHAGSSRVFQPGVCRQALKTG